MKINNKQHITRRGVIKRNPMPREMFTTGELASIQRRTNNNYHIENRIFIAKKIGSKLLPEFERIKKIIDKGQGISGQDSEDEYKLSQQLMLELKNNYPGVYIKVQPRL